MKHAPLTRRQFVARAGAGLSLTALAASLPRYAVAAGSSSRQLGVALVGLGYDAMNELAPALQETQHCYLAALVTGTPAKAKRYGAQYAIAPSHIYNYDTFDRIADNPDVDIVYVVLPNSLHAEYTIRAAQAGKHVICEKPMAVSVAECERMIAACAASNVTLNIGYRLHFDPYNLEIRRLGKEQPFGPVRYVHTDFSFFIGDPNQWRLRRSLAGGGPLMDIGIYCIQAARYATGEEPIAVTAQSFTSDHDVFAEVEETISWQLEFPSGAIANATSSYNAAAERLYVSYRDSYAKAELSPAYVYRGLQGHINGAPLDFGNPSQQARHMDAVAQSIRSGATLTCSGEEGLRDQRIIEAIYRSAASDRQRIPLAVS